MILYPPPPLLQHVFSINKDIVLVTVLQVPASGKGIDTLATPLLTHSSFTQASGPRLRAACGSRVSLVPPPGKLAQSFPNSHNLNIFDDYKPVIL